MRQLRSPLVFIVVLLGLGGLAAALPEVPSQEKSGSDESDALALESLDLQSEIDRSVRWLRDKQSPDGSYGGAVKSTAWVLQAFALSPRSYARSDGPFVAKALDYLASKQNPENGGIYIEGPDKDYHEIERTAQSALAWLALSQYEDEKSDAIRLKLETFFSTPMKPAEGEPLTREEARAKLRDWLARRKADASWEGPDGAIIRTSEGIIALSRCRKALRPEQSVAKDGSLLPKFSDANRKKTLSAMERGALFLVASSENGLWGAPGKPDLGLSSMALGALLELPAPRPKEIQSIIDSGLNWIVTHQNEDGSIHDGKLKNYLTSASVLALAKSGDPRFAPVIEKARRFLLTLQADEGEGYSDGDLFYGGIGYDSQDRPDMSNLQMALEALAAAGTKSDDESFARAVKFLERTQNRSESNDTHIESDGSVIRSGNDGGGVYAPGDSKSGFEVLPDGTKIPRSYGSMTYALLKGFIFAGLPKDDPRMQAAWKWIGQHYTLDVNPGFEHSADPAAPYQGLFYYFHTMARALHLYGEEEVVDAAGTKHAWREQLCGRLVAMQRKDDGSWINANAPRWWEGNPVMATSYALLTMGSALPRQ